MRRYRYYRCRKAYGGPVHDRCASRYVSADALEAAVLEQVAGVLARPEIVLAELLAGEGPASARVEQARERLASIEAQRRRLARLFQIDAIDEQYLTSEVARLRAERARLEGLVRQSDGTSAAPSSEHLARACEAVRSWILDRGQSELPLIARALRLSVEVVKDGDEVVGELSGVIPGEAEISHHCTNIGMTTWTKVSSPTGRKTPGLEGDEVSIATRSVPMTSSTSVR